MSRSGYCEDGDFDNWSQICWRGAVMSAIRGKRGQAFLREMLAALDALPEKKLIAHELEMDGAVCAIGSVGRARGVDMSKLNPEDYHTVAGTFGINEKLVQEIVWFNDDLSVWGRRGDPDTPENQELRFRRVREWVVSNLQGGEPS